MPYKKEFEVYETGVNQFFGYYDRSQFNQRGEGLYCRGADEFSKFDICIWDPQRGSSQTIFETSAVGYQLGNLNSWLSQEEVVVHSRVGDDICAHIVSTSNGAIIDTMDSACYAVYKGLGVLYKIENAGLDRPAYGLGAAAQKSNTVRLYDFEKHAVLYSLDSDKIGTFLGGQAHWYMEHCCFLNSQALLLLYRTSVHLSGEKKEALLLWNFEEDKITRFGDFSKMSHFKGADDVALLFGSKTNISRLGWLKNMVKKVPALDRLRTNPQIRDRVVGESYWRFKDGGFDRIKFFRDGHPTRVNDGFVFDTYETPETVRELYYLSDNQDLPQRICTVPSCVETDSTPQRTDLHPRALSCGSGFSIDFIRNGSRGFAVFRVE
ncbi:hypothetical protein N9X77_06510 [Luminiphilus sp.]|nr:hypothetical protein [Luminiphilus sp.]